MWKKLLVASATILAIASAHATVITFEGHPTDGGIPIVDSGYDFYATSAGWAVVGPGAGCCNINYNGTSSLFLDGDRSGNAFVTMTSVNGDPFSLGALDASVYWIGAPADQILVTGVLQGGGTVNASLSIGDSWQHYTFSSSFTDLTSVTFTDATSGGFLDAPGFGLDNIDTTPSTSSVPETSSLGLMVAGLALLGGLARRRKA